MDADRDAAKIQTAKTRRRIAISLMIIAACAVTGFLSFFLYNSLYANAKTIRAIGCPFSVRLAAEGYSYLADSPYILWGNTTAIRVAADSRTVDIGVVPWPEMEKYRIPVGREELDIAIDSYKREAGIVLPMLGGVLPTGFAGTGVGHARLISDMGTKDVVVGDTFVYSRGVVHAKYGDTTDELPMGLFFALMPDKCALRGYYVLRAGETKSDLLEKFLSDLSVAKVDGKNGS